MEAGKTEQGTKNSIRAAGLSFLFPGLGQLHNKQPVKAVFLIASMVLLPFAGMNFLAVQMSLEIMLAIEALIWLSSIYDAYVSADTSGKGESK